MVQFQKKENCMVLDPANGVVKAEGGCLCLQQVLTSAVEEHN
jgi:hypothetical protein